MAPASHLGQRERQQAVVWLAQDVYKAHYDKLETIDDQLELVRLWRDILAHFDDLEGVRKVENLLAGVWGEDAPKMLGEVQEENRKRFMDPSPCDRENIP